MSRYCLALVVLGALAAGCGVAKAAPASEQLSACVSAAITPADRDVLAVTAFTAMAQSPAVTRFSKVSSTDLEAAQRGQGALFEGLFFTDCRTETIAALKAEGVRGIGPAAQVLGRLSVNVLTNQRDVAAATNKGFDYVDRGKLNDALKAAGLPETAGR